MDSTIKIHAYFICYNEKLILPHLIKYYSSFCERITIIDNYSNDGSYELAKTFPKVNVLRCDSINNEMRDNFYLLIKNRCWKSSRGFADYVVVGDCDEFIYHNDIIKFFTEAKRLGVTVIKPNGFYMVANPDFNIELSKDLINDVTEGVREVQLDKLMVFDPNQIKEINFGFGCNCSPIGIVKIGRSSNFLLKRFKFLGLKNYIYKSMEYGRRLSSYNKLNELGSHYLKNENDLIIDYNNFVKNRVKL